jgi:ABC-2 type transport system permease protein
MSKLWLIARYEYRRHVLRKGFLLGLLSVPLLITVIALVAGFLSLMGRMGQDVALVGYVDLAGLVADSVHVPAGSDSGETVRLAPFQTEEAASAALSSGQIEAYFVLADDYQETHQVELVVTGEPASDVIGAFRAFLQAELLANQPRKIAHRAIAGSQSILRSPDGRLEFAGKLTLKHLLPPLAGLTFVVLIFMSSGYLTQAMVEEKVNRTMEILVTSLSPSQLVSGKLMGIITVTLTQFAGWTAFAALSAFVGGQVLRLEWLQDISMDPSAILLLVALLVPAYVLVATLMMTLGIALADVRGSQQVVAIFISLYMIPLGLILPVIGNPNSPLAIGLSLFPLTAPVMLPLRFALVLVPLWQIAIAVAIQSLLALGALWLAVRTFRLGMLRFGKGLRWRELLGLAAAQPASQPHASQTTRAVATADHATVQAHKRRPSKTLLVLRHELWAALSRPLYLLMTIGLPVLLYVQVLIMQVMVPGETATSYQPRSAAESASAHAPVAPEVQGYVDRSGLIQTIPHSIPAGVLLPYADEASAHQALAKGEIAAFHIVPSDYVTTGELVTVHPDVSPLAPGSPSGLMDWVLLVNLVGGDAVLAGQVWDPMDLHQVRAPSAERPPDSDDRDMFQLLLTRWLPSLIMLVLYGVIALGAGMLLTSVSDEKKNQVMEVLLVSLSPRQMLTGKIIALGIASLLQAVAWGGIGYVLLGVVGMGSSLPAGIELPPSLLVWGGIFFVLGYAVYGTLMAGAGALVPNVKESPFVSLMFYVPAFIGFEISLFSLQNPHGALSTAASLFPLTAPFSMMHRLVVGGVPLWQLLLSTGLMLVTIPLIVRGVSRMFRAQVLLSGQPFTVKRYFRVLLRRAGGV